MLPTPSTKEIAALYYQLTRELSSLGITAGDLFAANTVSGGDINTSLRLETSTAVYFLKLNHQRQLPTFTAEAKGLEAIAKTGTVRCPAPLLWGSWRDYSYLLLEFVTLQRQGSWHDAGQQLAQLHRSTAVNEPDSGTAPDSNVYGFEIDTYCGTSLQTNHWNSNWADFFVEQRIRPQMNQLGRHSPDLIERHCNGMSSLLRQHQPRPALLHGDLWSGNIGFCNSGPMIYDPASYIGDRETDLAMSQLFGGFPKEFYSSYQQHYPIAPDYQRRRPIYQLYHLLNHANLFGSHYYEQVDNCLLTITRSL